MVPEPTLSTGPTQSPHPTPSHPDRNPSASPGSTFTGKPVPTPADEEPTLPRTGPGTTALIVVGGLLVVAGAGLVFLFRARRRVQ